MYFPLSVITAFTLILAFQKTRKTVLKQILYVFVFILIIGRINGILAESKKFEMRIEEMKGLVENARTLGGSKFIVREDSLKSDANWSYPIETLLLSSYNPNFGSITICTNVDMEFENNQSKVKLDEYLFRRWEIFPVSSLNSKYFRLNEGVYLQLK